MFTVMRSDGHYMVKDNEIVVFGVVFDREREVVALSLENIQRIISSFDNSNSWSLQLLRITNSRRAGTQYASRQITLSPNGKLSDFINEISARYTGAKNNLSQLFTGVFEYDGSAISNRIYKLTRACSHKPNTRISEEILAECKAKICRRTVVRQKFLTRQSAKFAGKTCVWAYVNRP